MNSKRYLILTVLYNQSLEDSLMINSLLKIKSDDFFAVIWDNSPKTSIDLTKLNTIKYKYYHTPENYSLSKVYNYCINQFQDKFDFLWIFDQDSVLSQIMFDKFNTAISNNSSVNLFLPQVLGQNNAMLSPGKLKFFKASYFKDKISGLINNPKIIAIMSGTCISSEFIKIYSYRFDERLQLYGIDTKFYIEYCQRNIPLYIVDYRMEHDLSFFTETNVSKLLIKFKEHKKSLRIVIGERSILQSVLLEFYITYLSIKNVIKHKTIGFLF